MESDLKCPYRDICPVDCPGDAPGEADWIPVEGFESTPEGVLCMDWGTIVPQELLLRPEGRHLSGVDAADKTSGSFEFTGNALAAHTMNPDGFTISYSLATRR